MLRLIQHICSIGKNVFTLHSIKLCSLIVRIIGSNLYVGRNSTIMIKNKNYLSIAYDAMRMENKNESRYSCARAAVDYVYTLHTLRFYNVMLTKTVYCMAHQNRLHGIPILYLFLKNSAFLVDRRR